MKQQHNMLLADCRQLTIQLANQTELDRTKPNQSKQVANEDFGSEVV